MTINQLKSNPAFLEHWSHVAGQVDALLVEQLVQTCAGIKGGDNAQAEVGSVKALAGQLNLFRSLGNKSAPSKPLVVPPLRRHQGEDKKAEKPKP